MVLEAFWAGDTATLETLADDSVTREFTAAIDERKAQGLTLDNRVVRIDRAMITDASLNGMMAHVTVRFDADLVAVTRDANGDVVAGSTSDAVSRSEEHTSELQSLMRTSYAVFCLEKKNKLTPLT